jgi:hypothetical protein
MGRGKPYGRMGAISAGGYPPKRKTRRGEDPDYAGRPQQPHAVMHVGVNNVTGSFASFSCKAVKTTWIFHECLHR